MLRHARLGLLVPFLSVLGAGCGDGAPEARDGAVDAPVAVDAAVVLDASLSDAPRVLPYPDVPTRVGTTLHVRIVDSATGALIPGMISLFDTAGRMLHFGIRIDSGTPTMGATIRHVGGALTTWHGLVVWRGEAALTIGEPWLLAEEAETGADRGVPHGVYRLVASRGTEYDLTETVVDLSAGRGDVFIEIPLARTVDTTGYYAADMHVHAAPGSGDARILTPDRLKTMAVAGIDVVVSADHDFNTDFAAVARELWPSSGDPAPLATVNGNEASGVGGHFGVFPVVVDTMLPRNGATPSASLEFSPQSFLEQLHALPGTPLVQLNHARLGFAGYFTEPYHCGGWRDRSQRPSCSVDFDAMEVIGGYLSCGTKIDEAMKDWYTLLRFGIISTATGNSDSHGTSNILGGFPRTYVRAADDRVAAFDENKFVRALIGHQAMATTGPFLNLWVNGSHEPGDTITVPGGKVSVKIRMQAAAWVRVDEVRLLLDGTVVKTWPVPVVGGTTPLFETSGEIVTLPDDGFITVEAHGDTPLPLSVVGELMAFAPEICPPRGTAQPGMVPFAVTNPVFIDVDGDGRVGRIAPWR